MSKFINKFIICFLVICTVLSPLSLVASAEDSTEPVVQQEDVTFEGKTISILGDSICTYENASSGIAAQTTNSTIKNNRDYYKVGRNEVNLEDTWWMQAAATLGAEILVNNSYSNTTIFSPFSDGEELGYLTRPYNLHDNTGENSGEEPDIVAVYMGTNDFSYHKSRLGSFDEINFSTLIREINGEYAYKKPVTSAEAYAIMLHKIKTTYKNAEVYCFTLLQRQTNSANDSALFRNFNTTISRIAEYMDCYVVDLYNESGITDNEKVLNRYLLDAYLHPNKKGMDAIESVFLSSLYKNSKYSPADEICNIEYNLNDVIVNEGIAKTIPVGKAFNCTFTNLEYGSLDVNVTMNSEDITESVFSGNTIHIPEVTGDIKISASVSKTNRIFKNYRFEKTDNGLQNVAGNENFQNRLSAHESGGLNTQDDILLCYDTPWSVVFRAQGYNAGKITPLSTDSENGFCLLLDTDNAILGFYGKSKTDEIYGIDLDKYNIDMAVPHTYKIINTHNINGTNAFTVYVDSKEIGLIDTYFTSSKAVGNDVSPLFEKDFIFNVVGENNIALIDYIQVWENDALTNHKHKFAYPVTTSPTCTEYGSTISTCDCGEAQSLPNINPTGHTEGNWIISKQTSAKEPGEAYKKCTVCDDITQTKTIPQLKCEKPVINSLTNTTDGVKVTWNAVTGADSYRVYRHLKGGKWVYLCTTTERSYIDTDVKNGYWYYYTVRAVNEAGYSDFYTTGNAIQYLLSPIFTKHLNTQNGIYLSWNKIYGAQGYYLYKKTGNGNWQYYCRVNSTSFTDKNVKNGVTYAYRIKAVRNKTVSGYYVNGATITRLTSPVLKAPINTDSGIKLQWNKMSGAAGYFVYKKVGGYWRYIGKTSTNVFTDTTATPGSVNVYTVKAYDINGNHSTYNTKGITTKRLLTPKITGSASVKSGIQIRWNDVKGAQGYYIYRKTGTGGWKYIGKATSKTYTDKSAAKGTNYTYTVKAYSGSYVSTYSAKGITTKR